MGLCLPLGIIHDYLVLRETAVVAYKVTVGYAPANDSVVHWEDSLGLDWGMSEPVASVRDLSFQVLMEVESLFTSVAPAAHQ